MILYLQSSLSQSWGDREGTACRTFLCLQFSRIYYSQLCEVLTHHRVGYVSSSGWRGTDRLYLGGEWVCKIVAARTRCVTLAQHGHGACVSEKLARHGGMASSYQLYHPLHTPFFFSNPFEIQSKAPPVPQSPLPPPPPQCSAVWRTGFLEMPALLVWCWRSLPLTLLAWLWTADNPKY